MFASIAAAALVLAASASAQLTQITENFGPNPRNVGFYIHVPSKLQAKPPILVVPHWCHGSAQAAYSGRNYASLGDQYGFITIWPDSPNTADKCWDVSSTQTLTHNGGGDSQGIVSMVQWTLKKYNGDASRVFSTGTSSGAMMTNVLLGAYPDVFAAGAAWAGVAFGCFAGNGYDVWSNACATGQVTKTPAQWAALVQNAYPGYTGFRPKFQVAHGTADTTLYPQNLQEEIKQWTAVFGYSQTPTQTLSNNPVNGWTKSIYGPKFQSYSAAGVTHDITEQTSEVIQFFDLACDSSKSACYSRNSTVTASSRSHARQF